MIEDILSLFGMTSDIATYAAIAMQDPSRDNINALVAAYADNGQVIPGKLYVYLIQQHDIMYPNEPMIEINYGLIILILGIGAYVFFGRKRR